MTSGLRLALLLGCVLVAALESPLCARVAREDVFGPYAQDRIAAQAAPAARAGLALDPVANPEGGDDGDPDDPDRAQLAQR